MKIRETGDYLEDIIIVKNRLFETYGIDITVNRT
jgi:hypothetical protein